MSRIREHVPVVVARPLPRGGGVAEDHGAPEARQLPGVWTRGRKKTESAKIEHVSR